MKGMMRKFVLLAAAFCMIMSLPGTTVRAAESIYPKAVNNTSVSLRKKSALVPISNGYMRVYYTGETIGIEYYDSSFQITEKKAIDMELPIWGGFFAGSGYYYVVEGQNNVEESDTAEVIRVIKYDLNWKRIGAAQITGSSAFGGEVRYPFDYGCVEMTENDGMLYIVTGHEGYVDPTYNQGHQGFLMIAVDEATMTGQIVKSDLWHSFAQYIEYDNSNLYVLEQSEGSRYTKLSKYSSSDYKGSSIPVLEYGGDRTSAWAIACYASVDDMALSENNVLCIGTSIDQTKYDEVSSETSHNIYLTVTPKDNFTKGNTTVKWLTSYENDGRSFYGVNITRINENRFLIIWEEKEEQQAAQYDDGLSSGILRYMFVDGNGDRLGQEYNARAMISDCHPVLNGKKVCFYSSGTNVVDFYSIDCNTGAFDKKVYRTVGDNVTWDLEDGVLRISGSGAIEIETKTQIRYPLSTTDRWIISTSGGAWQAVKNEVTKLVIDTGVTSIPDNAFSNFENLEEVIINPGLVSIGEKAFYGCNKLKKITIPSTVTSIGEDFLWTGYTWTSSGKHVVRAAICAPKDSYAAQYAKDQGISYEEDSSANDGQDKTDKEEEQSGDKNEEQSGDKKGEQSGDKKEEQSGNKNDSVVVIGENGEKIALPKRVTISNVSSPKSKAIKVAWKKDKQADGYLLQYATNSKFTKNRKQITINKNSIVTKKITRLKKGKKYYVRVAAYKTVSGRRYCGSWSKTKKIKCK